MSSCVRRTCADRVTTTAIGITTIVAITIGTIADWTARLKEARESGPLFYAPFSLRSAREERPGRLAPDRSKSLR